MKVVLFMGLVIMSFFCISCENGCGTEEIVGDADAGEGDPDIADGLDGAGDMPDEIDLEIPETADGADVGDMEVDDITSECGDGLVEGVEECDDGRNGDNDDGCTDECRFSCHADAECDDGYECTDDMCDTDTTHACSHPLSSVTTLCRPSAGECDVEEHCDGAQRECPVDGFEPDTTMCRPAAWYCDAAEYCTGLSADCPDDAFQPVGTSCDDGEYCTDPDECNEEGVCFGTPLDELHGVLAIASGYIHNCAIIGTGGVQCWGANIHGHLGDGTRVDRPAPVDTLGLSAGVSVLEAWGNHSCVILGSGGMKCWGSNDYGQLGDGTTVDRDAPVDVSGLSSVVSAIAIGADHTCVITDVGGVMCWGSNNHGQLGDGTTEDRIVPVSASGLSSGAVSIEAGYYHTCAVMDTGGVKCWGHNGYGQLGDGTTEERTTPVDVAGLPSDVTAIAIGGYATCAVTPVGGMKCWGHNEDGQLGDGTTQDRTEPVDVTGLSSAVSAAAAGANHTCAVLDTGVVQCWGVNDFGQLGDGTTEDRTAPVDVLGLSSGVSAVAAGGYHTCALLDTGHVQCWGGNMFGQLGNGTTTESLESAYVLCM